MTDEQGDDDGQKGESDPAQITSAQPTMFSIRSLWKDAVAFPSLWALTRQASLDRSGISEPVINFIVCVNCPSMSVIF